MKINKYIGLALAAVVLISCEKHEIQYDAEQAGAVAEFQLHYMNPVNAVAANNINKVEINGKMIANSKAPLTTYNAIPKGSVGRFYTVTPGNVNIKLYYTTKLLPASDSLVYDQNVTLTQKKQNVFVHDFNKPPVVFDNLHHALNLPTKNLPDSAWVDLCAATWKPSDGRQKIHYAQQSTDGKPGAHSRTIAINGFLEYMAPLAGRSLDVMLEVKDKNLSAIKCMLCLAENPRIDALEREWGRYKYAVLEHSQHHYQRIRSLLNDKTEYSAVAFYNLVESALEHPVDIGSAANAAMHVWGYFKKEASDKSKAEFERLLKGYVEGQVSLERLKRLLYKHAQAYDENYLLQSYYFE